jgi:diguanylate cyclase (GGDEF)-like protein/PAS domain S-box-containing protein
MGEQYLLTDLTLLHPSKPSEGAALPLTAPVGILLGQLTWKPVQPGHELLRFLLPTLLIAIIGLGTFAVLVLRNARRSARAIAVSADTIGAYAQTLEASEARFRDVAEATSDWIWETDPELRFTYLSARFGEVTGVAAAAVLGKKLEQFFASDSVSDGWDQMRGETQLHRTVRDLRCSYRDALGTSRICRLAGRPITDPARSFLGYRGTATDITAEVEAQAKAHHLSLHDPLTELPNRVLLRDRLDQALANADRESGRVAVMCLDLDHFKEVNDTLGHGAGDEILKEVAARLRDCVRGNDTVARLGGDEFSVVHLAINPAVEAQALCRRLIECFKTPFQVEGHELFIGVSIGVAIAPHDGTDHERLLKNADIALYRAKQAGRATFRFFEQAMDSELQARKALEHDLRQALAKNQLEMHYQPLVTIKGEDSIGVEALMRWRHPTRGIVPPMEFIPIAEETGLIIAIGEWALRQACTDAVAWPRLRVAVNLSPVQFKHHELVEMIKQVLAETRLDPARLELEITESVLLYDTSGALKVLSALKMLGIRIAMDDFGTGYSSLGYLNSFPFDKIKIDRSFIAELNGKEKANAIVKSVIGLGQSLEMVTTAEGVETLEQLKFLAEEGCEQVQGYYFGRPVPAQELVALIKDWRAAAAAAAAAA